MSAYPGTDLEKLIISTEVDKGPKVHPLRLLSNAQQEILSEHIDTLKEIKAAVSEDEAKYIFSFAVPALMRANGGGIEAVIKFKDKILQGCNPWAACLAVVSNPEPFFRRLTEEMDFNNNFANWLTTPEKAAHELWEATRGDPNWDAGGSYEENPLIEAWKTGIFTPVGGWNEAANPQHPEKFILEAEGFALGSEIERRNNGLLATEVSTPHTTNLEAFAEYLQNAKQYFIDTEGMFPPHHLWNMHLNLSLTPRAYYNISTEAYVDEEFPDGIYPKDEITNIAELLLFPTNPYARNIFIENDSVNKPDGQILIKRELRDTRCPERDDKGRLEMKCCSVWAGMDVEYLMGCMKIMHILSENPALMPAFKEKLETWYSTLPKPAEFIGKKVPAEDTPESEAVAFEREAEQYETASLRVREAMKARFAEIFSDLESRARVDFRSKVSQSSAPPARG